MDRDQANTKKWKSTIMSEISKSYYDKAPDAGMAKAMIGLRLEPDTADFDTTSQPSAGSSSTGAAAEILPPWKKLKTWRKRAEYATCG